MSIMDDSDEYIATLVPYWTEESELQEGHSEKDYRALLEAYWFAKDAILDLFKGNWTPVGEVTSERISAALGTAHTWTDAECEEMIEYMRDHRVVEPWSKMVEFMLEVKCGKLSFARRYPYQSTCPVDFIRTKVGNILVHATNSIH